MKGTILFLIKLSLFIFFVHNIGIISYVANFEAGEPPPIKDEAGRQEDVDFLNNKINRARDLGDAYAPEEYFADLAEIMLKEQDNDFDMSILFLVNSSRMELFGIFDDVRRRILLNKTKEERGAYLRHFEEVREDFMETIEPGYKQMQEEYRLKASAPGYRSGILLKFLSFLGNFYLKNLFLAFILLWTWWYQEKEKIKIDNPLSFLFCLVFYPVVIIRTWRKIINRESRFVAMSVELRRRDKNLFSLFSENEISELRRLARSNMKLSEYRKYLDQGGLIRQHSLLPSIAVTTVFLALPFFSSSQEGHQMVFAETEKYLEDCSACMNSPPLLIFCYQEDGTCSNVSQEKISVDYGGPGYDHDYDHGPYSAKSGGFSAGIILENSLIYFEGLILELISFVNSKISSGYKNNPEPIPLTVNDFLLNSNEVKNSLTNRRRHEKSIFYYGFGILDY